MSRQPLIQTSAQLLFIGPIVGWRIITMAIASTQVILRRSRILATRRKTDRQRREIGSMVQEKFLGANEAVYAAQRSLIRATKNFDIELVSPVCLPLYRKSVGTGIMANLLNFSVTVVTVSLLIPLHSTLFVVQLFLDTTQPLHKRVTENSRRLRDAKLSR